MNIDPANSSLASLIIHFYKFFVIRTLDKEINDTIRWSQKE